MKTPGRLKLAGLFTTILLLGVVFYFRAAANLSTQDYRNTNFFSFWLSGRMVLSGENPYDEAQYLAEHDTFDVTWRPNRIFPYPLPLALLMTPLGLFSLRDAYVIWQILTQVLIAATVAVLLNHWHEPPQRRLFVPLVLFLIFFGPILLTLQIGAIGGLTLAFLLGALLLLEKRQDFWAGLMLALTLLKPPQGVTLLLLFGVWFLARRNWRAIAGVAAGGIALLVIGLIQDPLWVVKFRMASQAVMDRTQGIHSNVWAFSYLACKGAPTCSTVLGAAGALTLLGLGGLLLWRTQAGWSAWEAMNFILPIAFVSTVYLWEYDQILYVIPITWIVGTLLERRESYIPAFLFLIVMVLYSLFALLMHATTLKDLWSLGNTLIVLGMTLLLSLGNRSPWESPIDKPLSPA